MVWYPVQFVGLHVSGFGETKQTECKGLPFVCEREAGQCHSTPGLLLGSLRGAEGRLLVLRQSGFELGVALQTSSRYASQTWCALRVSRLLRSFH